MCTKYILQKVWVCYVCRDSWRIRDSRDKVWIELVAKSYELGEGVRKAQGGKD